MYDEGALILELTSTKLKTNLGIDDNYDNNGVREFSLDSGADNKYKLQCLDDKIILFTTVGTETTSEEKKSVQRKVFSDVHIAFKHDNLYTEEEKKTKLFTLI